MGVMDDMKENADNEAKKFAAKQVLKAQEKKEENEQDDDEAS